MIYKVEWSEVKKEGTSANGRTWKITEMTLKDEQGVITEKVSTFDSIMTGQEIEGTIADGKYGKEFKRLEKPEFMKKPNMDRIVEKKAGLIAEAQTNKAQQIAQAQDRSAWMWAKTNASTLLGTSMATENNSDIAKAVIDLATKIYNAEPIEPF